MKKSTLLLTCAIGIIPFIVFAQTTVSGGDVSGIWDITGSPYQILGDVTIQPGATLVIEPGVEIISETNVDIKVFGRLLAIGEVDSVIIFTASNQMISGWGGIEFHDSADDDSEISNAKIEYALAGIWVSFAYPELKDLELSHNATGLFGANNSNAEPAHVLENIEFLENEIGFYAEWRYDSKFTNCLIHGNSIAGVYLAQHLQAGAPDSLEFDHCLIFNNYLGFQNMGFFRIISLVNTTITNNTTSEFVIETSGINPPTSNVENSILWGGAFEDGIVLTGNPNLNVSYSNISLFTDTFPGTGNINQDPIFNDISNDDYSLNCNSPCIDTGNPDSPLDPDGSIADMGAFWFDSSTLGGSVSNDSPICEGGEVTLMAGGGVSYEWNGESGFSSTNQNPILSSVTPDMAGEYSVTITTSDGCLIELSTEVIVNSMPIAGVDGNLSFCEGGNTTLTANGGTDYDWSTGDNTASITVSVADDYTVTVTDSNGCTDTETVSVISNQLPTAGIDGNLEFCDGDNTTLTASGGIDYDWSTGDNTASITVGTADDYTVTVTDSNGCTDTETVTTIVNDLPPVELKLERDTFCINETDIELIGGTPNGGDYSGSGIMGNIFDPSTAGVGIHLITYTYEDGDGCMNSDSQEIVVEDGDCTTGTSSIEINESVKVYPNPSSGNFSISLEDWTGRINIQIFDTQGRLINVDEKESNRFEIENVRIGIYFLKVSNDKYVAIKKLIVQ